MPLPEQIDNFAKQRFNKSIPGGHKFLLGDLLEAVIANILAPTAMKLPSSTPVNAVAADETLDVTGVVEHGETFTIGGVDIYEFLTTSSQEVTTPGNLPVDISGHATAQVETIDATKGTGIRQVETIVCTAGESTGAGNITMTITAAGMPNSPKAVVVAIGAEDDTVEEVGALVRTALGLDADVSSMFVFSGTGANIILTAITPAANDGTFAFGFVDTDSTGVTFGASGNTTAGVAPAAGNILITLTAAGVAGSPLGVVIPIGATDYDAADVGALVRTALGNTAAITAFYDVGGTGADIVLTALIPAVDDGTLAMAFTDTDTTGTTFGSSTNTTGGVACIAANAILAIDIAVAALDTQGVGSADAAGDTCKFTADVKGVLGNEIACIQNMVNATFGAGLLSGGIDGTVGAIREIRMDTSYVYFLIAANLISGANWRRISLGSVY